MPDMPTGALVRLYRIERRMSAVSLATHAHAGITTRYLEMIEANSKTPSLPVLRKLAKILGVRTSALVGEGPSEAHEGPVNPRLAEVEHALFTYRSIRLTNGTELPTLAELNDIAWETEVWCAGNPTHLIHFNGERFIGPYGTTADRSDAGKLTDPSQY